MATWPGGWNMPSRKHLILNWLLSFPEIRTHVHVRTKIPVCVDEAVQYKEQIDVMLLCGGLLLICPSKARISQRCSIRWMARYSCENSQIFCNYECCGRKSKKDQYHFGWLGSWSVLNESNADGSCSARRQKLHFLGEGR